MSKHTKSVNGPHPAIDWAHYIRGTEKSKSLVTGPKAVVDRFNKFCDFHNLSKWEGLEILMNIAGQLDEELELAGDTH